MLALELLHIRLVNVGFFLVIAIFPGFGENVPRSPTAVAKVGVRVFQDFGQDLGFGGRGWSLRVAIVGFGGCFLLGSGRIGVVGTGFLGCFGVVVVGLFVALGMGLEMGQLDTVQLTVELWRVLLLLASNVAVVTVADAPTLWKSKENV